MSDLPQVLGKPDPTGAIRIGNLLLDYQTLNLNDLALFEQTFAFGLDEWAEKARQAGTMTCLRFLAWRCLVKQDKSLTLEQVGEMVTLGDLSALEEQISGDGEKGGA